MQHVATGSFPEFSFGQGQVLETLGESAVVIDFLAKPLSVTVKVEVRGQRGGGAFQ